MSTQGPCEQCSIWKQRIYCVYGEKKHGRIYPGKRPLHVCEKCRYDYLIPINSIEEGDYDEILFHYSDRYTLEDVREYYQKSHKRWLPINDAFTRSDTKRTRSCSDIINFREDFTRDSIMDDDGIGYESIGKRLKRGERKKEKRRLLHVINKLKIIQLSKPVQPLKSIITPFRKLTIHKD